MQTPANPGDHTLIIGQRLLFDIRHDRLSHVARPEYPLKLERIQAEVLLQLARAPQVVLRRQQILETISSRYDIQLSGQTLDELVGALCVTLRRLDSGAMYIRTLPRLGYVLVTTAVATLASCDLDEPWD